MSNNQNHPATKDKVNPHDIFLLAQEFETATKLLRQSIIHVILTGGPGAVLGAFTVELYFKCLILLDTETQARGHSLYKFFDKLSPKTKQRVEELYNYDCNRYPPWSPYRALTLDMLLKRSSDSFTIFRYYYEYKGKPEAASGNWSVTEPLRNAVKNAILEIKPEWRENKTSN